MDKDIKFQKASDFFSEGITHQVIRGNAILGTIYWKDSRHVFTNQAYYFNDFSIHDLREIADFLEKLNRRNNDNNRS